MQKTLILFLLSATSFKSYSQANSHHKSFYVSVDALSVLNSVIQSELKTFSISGEICIDHTYGLMINASIDNEHLHNYNRRGMEFNPEFRLYLGDEECSAFHIGAYASFGAAKVIRDERFSSNTYLKYEESIFGGGVSAGYKVLLRDRWTIDPAFYFGFSNRYKLLIDEAINAWPQSKESGLEVSVILGVGYRFR